MPNIRMFPIAGVAKTLTFDGRTYTVAAASYVDVPSPDHLVLEANGWVRAGYQCQVGATSARPTTYGLPQAGWVFMDTTLGYLVLWNGTGWVNPSSGAAA